MVLVVCDTERLVRNRGSVLTAHVICENGACESEDVQTEGRERVSG